LLLGKIGVAKVNEGLHAEGDVEVGCKFGAVLLSIIDTVGGCSYSYELN
jgi:hypothetical protein